MLLHGRTLLAVFSLLLTVAPEAFAQRTVTAAAGDPAARQLAALRVDSSALRLPPDAAVTHGARTIAAGSQIDGPVATSGGPLDVYGTVLGDAIAVGGDVVVHQGGRVTGNALSAFGHVRLAGGSVDGDARELGGEIGSPPAPAVARARTATTLGALKLAFGCLGFLLLTGIGTLVLAHDCLDGVVGTLEHRFARSFWTGVAAQCALLPALLVLVVGLAITLVGILLIPFGIVAFGIAVAGLLTLGFLAAALVTGRSLLRPSTRATLSPRGATLRALVVGVVVYSVLWLLAAALTRYPAASGSVAVLAFLVSWVGTTAGFGAALLSRAGTRSTADLVAPPMFTPVAAPAAWQTPTPIAGVAAARRPSVGVTSGSPP